MNGDAAPIAYIERTRSYYLALGYANPYQWARHEDALLAPEELTRLRAEAEKARRTAKDIRLNTLNPSSANRA